jgi:hypothetical protein
MARFLLKKKVRVQCRNHRTPGGDNPKELAGTRVAWASLACQRWSFYSHFGSGNRDLSLAFH